MAQPDHPLNEQTIRHWLSDKFAHKKAVEITQIDPDQLFIDFGIDSTEVLVLAGELEEWIGLELPATAMWYHPTINKLSAFIAQEYQSTQAE
jgi:acyl carrier protein